MRAAKNSGISVPSQTLKRTIAYIKGLHDAASGGFCYQHAGDGPGFARSAAGICVLQFSGAYDAKEIAQGVQYLRGNLPSSEDHRVRTIRVGNGREITINLPTPREHFWYGQYYAAHAMHQVGGRQWRQWYAAVSKMLLEHQSADSSWAWSDSENIGSVYQTSIAVIILSIPASYVPVFQR